MPSIDESIKKIDSVICRHLDEIENNSRGAISQDILEQLTKFVNHIMLKFYANGREIPINAENISKATEFAQINSDLYTLYKFHNYLEIVTTQYTLDEDGSERLMLKYYQYLLEAKNLLKNHFGIEVLHNIEKFPLRLDNTLQEYYKKMSEKIELHPAWQNATSKDKYYIQKTKPLFVNGKTYHEVTFAPVDDRKNKSKSNRVIAFTKLPIKSNYASKFHLINETIEILGKTMPIIIIDSWEVSIRDCEFQNFISLIKGEKIKVPYAEQRLICEFLTKTRYTLTALMDFPDKAYEDITFRWKSNLKSKPVFIPVLDKCRDIIRKGRNGHNVLRYLLFIMNNVIIKNQFSSGYYSKYYEEWIHAGNSNFSGLYLSNGCKQFDTLPFNRSPIGHNPKLGILFECIPCKNKRPELFARFIRNNTEGRGQLFTDIAELGNFPDYPKLIEQYNDSLWPGHKPESDIILENNQVYINEYKLDTCKIIEKLQELAETGVDDYSNDVDLWLLFDDYEIDCDEKKDIITHIFSESKVGVIYGSAGVGKSTLINHVSHFFNSEDKLYLTQTNPAKENLMRKIDAENTTFSTIESFKQSGSSFKYKLLVIDECSTVSNKDMVEVLKKANFEMLLLVGDTYQIDAIQFGNWFSVLKSFLPESAVFELTKPHRTKDERLLELWDKVRKMDDTSKEVIARESYSLKVDESLLSSLNPDEAILCLNYDGLYGINNINRFLQESNPNPAVQWDVQQYKVDDPILFLDSDRFYPVIHNNMKGLIKGIEILDPDTHEERIQFDVEIPKALDESDLWRINLELLESSEDEEKSLVRFGVHKLKSADEDGDGNSNNTVVPFQIAYAVSIHKAQGLEYDTVKIVITDEVEELVTHNIFYTAITRARENLKIYWTPEVEEKVISRIKPRDISKDVELLKNYITHEPNDDSFDFLM